MLKFRSSNRMFLREPALLLMKPRPEKEKVGVYLILVNYKYHNNATCVCERETKQYYMYLLSSTTPASHIQSSALPDHNYAVSCSFFLLYLPHSACFHLHPTEFLLFLYLYRDVYKEVFTVHDKMCAFKLNYDASLDLQSFNGNNYHDPCRCFATVLL